MKLQKNQIPVLIILFHLIGLVGFILPFTQNLFKLLVPFHLCLMTLLIFWAYSNQIKKLKINFLILFSLGFLVEVLGVHSHLLFGTYHYGNTLGYTIWSVPLTMGLNWFLLIYAIGDLLQNINMSNPLRIVVASLLMVGIDYFIEPVAQKFDYWHWLHATIPVQNFIAWFLISIGLFAIYFKQSLPNQNHIGAVLFVSQCVFFIILNIFL